MVCIPPKVCYLSDRSYHRRAIMNEQAKSRHPLPIDETVRASDELAEILTLVQTGTGRCIPILLVQPGLWDGLLHWFRATLVREGAIDASAGARRGGGQSPGSSGCYFQVLRAPRPRPLGRGTRDPSAPMNPSSGDRKAASIRRATALLAWAPCAALAQTETPQGLEPVPDVPPPPARVESGEPLEPDVRIIRKKDATIEEYRINGNLYMIKVIPVIGRPYYLMDQDGDGRMETNMSELRENFVVPQWVLFSW